MHTVEDADGDGSIFADGIYGAVYIVELEHQRRRNLG